MYLWLWGTSECYSCLCNYGTSSNTAWKHWVSVATLSTTLRHLYFTWVVLPLHLLYCFCYCLLCRLHVVSEPKKRILKSEIGWNKQTVILIIKKCWILDPIASQSTHCIQYTVYMLVSINIIYFYSYFWYFDTTIARKLLLILKYS